MLLKLIAWAVLALLALALWKFIALAFVVWVIVKIAFRPRYVMVKRRF